jgi:hypothetical protein
LTLNVSSFGANPVVKWLGTALASGDMPANKAEMLCFDGANWNASTIGNAPSSGGTPASVVIQRIDISATGTTDISFTSIPQTYHNLRITCTGQSHTSTAFDQLWMKINNDTTGNHYMFSGITWGNIGPANDNQTTFPKGYAGRIAAVGAGANTVSSIRLYFPGYAISTAVNKEWFAETEGPNAAMTIGGQAPFAEDLKGWYIPGGATGGITQIDIYTNSTDYFMPGITGCTLIGEN